MSEPSHTAQSTTEQTCYFCESTDEIEELERDHEQGAPLSKVIAQANEVGMEPETVDNEIEKLRNKGEVYEPAEDHLRTTE